MKYFAGMAAFLICALVADQARCAPGLTPLSSVDSLKELEVLRGRRGERRKLAFLCEGRAPASLNPRCYELAELESSGGSTGISDQFPTWWERRCGEEMEKLNWEELLGVNWNSLPSTCQRSWKERYEELRYRLSKEDLNLLWLQRHRSN